MHRRYLCTLPVFLTIFSAVTLLAQTAIQETGGKSDAVSDADRRRVVDRDADSSTVEYTERLTNAVTGQVTERNHSYVEVGSGLNYKDESGQYQPSQDLIELTDDGGAAALRGRVKVRFSPNLNTAGAITLTTVSNSVFRSQPVGLYYFDAETGKSALVAAVKDTVGELHPPNQLVYPDCLDGVKADYRVTYTKAGIEADIVLLEQIPKPEGFGISSRSARLEWITEFLDPPTPESWRRSSNRRPTRGGVKQWRNPI